MVEDKKGIWYSRWQRGWSLSSRILGRQRGWSLSSRHWQTWNLKGEGCVRSAQWSSLHQTVVWLGVISVLPTQSNYSSCWEICSKRGGGRQSGDSFHQLCIHRLCIQQTCSAGSGVSCSPWDACPDWGVGSLSFCRVTSCKAWVFLEGVQWWLKTSRSHYKGPKTGHLKNECLTTCKTTFELLLS